MENDNNLTQDLSVDEIMKLADNLESGITEYAAEDSDVSFMDAVKAGVENMGSAMTALKAGVSNVFGDEEGEAAARQEFTHKKERMAKNLEGATDWRDIFDQGSIGGAMGKTLDYVKEQFGLNSPEMATILAGAAAGSKAGASLPIPVPLAKAISTIGGGTIGAAMAAIPLYTGHNIGRQIEEGKEIDFLEASFTSIPQFAIEGLLLKALTTTGLTPAAKALLKDVPEGTLKNVGGKIGELLAVGVPGEVIQQGFERSAADLDLTSPEAMQEYLDSAIGAIAVLSPIGALHIAATSGSSVKGEKRQPKNVEEIKEIVKEEVSLAEAPKSTFIETPEQAEKLIKGLGWNKTDWLTDAAKVKYANLAIDRAGDNLQGFFNQVIPEGSTLKEFLVGQQNRSLQNIAKSPKDVIVKKTQLGQPIGSPELETISTKDLSHLIKMNDIRDPLVTNDDGIRPEITIDSGDSIESLGAKIDLRRKVEEKRLTRQIPPKEGGIHEVPTIIDTPGSIQTDADVWRKDATRLNRMTKEDLIREATLNPEYALPENSLKRTDGKFKTVDEIKDLMFEERNKRMGDVQPIIDRNPITTKPLERVGTDLIDAIETGVKPLAQKINTNPKASKVLNPMLRKISKKTKALKVPIDLRKDLRISRTKNADGDFTHPIKAAHAINTMLTAVNLNNTEVSLKGHLAESFHHYLDNLSETERVSLVDDNFEKFAEAIGNTYLELPTKQVNYWGQTSESKAELLAQAFELYADYKRKGDTKNSFKLDPKTQKAFNAYYKYLESISDDVQSLGVSNFDEFFKAVSDPSGKTTKEQVFDSIDALRANRLMEVSRQLQRQHQVQLENVDMKALLQDKIKGMPDNIQDAFVYAKSFIASPTHLASKPTPFSLMYNLRRAQEDAQAAYLQEFKRAGEGWFDQPSVEVRTKAAETLALLSETEQKLQRDSEGALVFERDGNLVRLTHPEMVKAIESLDRLMKTVLDAGDVNMRRKLSRYVGNTARTGTVAEIKRSLDQIIKDGSLEDRYHQEARDIVGTIEEIQRLRSKPYVPRLRFGSRGFTVHLKSNVGKNGKVTDPSVQPVYHAQAETAGYFDRKFRGRTFKDDQYAQIQKDLKKYHEQPDKYVVFDNNSKGFEMTYDNISNFINRDAVTLEMLSGLLGADRTSEYYKNLKDELDKRTATKGYGKRFAQSGNIKGYSTDWDRVISAYVSSSANFYGKTDYMPAMEDLMNMSSAELVGEETSWILKKMKDYYDYVTSPNEDFQRIRMLNFLWTMGGNFSTAALQVMTLPTTSLGSMTQYNKNILENSKLLGKYMKIAASEFGKDGASVFDDGALVAHLDDPKLHKRLMEKHGMTRDDINAITKFYRLGRAGTGLLEEMIGRKAYDTRGVSGKVKNNFNTVTNLLASPISVMEQATRFSTFMAHYELFSKNPDVAKKAIEVLNTDERFKTQRELTNNTLIEDLAFFATDEAHAVFGKTGRSRLMQKGLGAFVFPFMTYPQNVIEMMMRMYGRGPEGRMAVGTTLGSLFLFSGLMGLPGGELLKELLEEFYKQFSHEDVDFEYMVRDKLTEMTGDPRPGMFLTQGGLRAFMGMDVSRRIGIPIPGQELLLAMMGIRGDMTDLLGVQGSILTQGIESWHSYNNDEGFMKVASGLTPTAMSNFMKAYTYADEGVRTKKGTQLIPRDEISTKDILLRAMGVTSSDIASAREEQYWVQTETRRTKPKMDSFRNRGKNYVTKAKQFLDSGDRKNYEIWKNKYRELTKEVAEYNRKRGIPYDMKAFHRSVNNAVAQRILGGVQYKGTSKTVRPKLEGIQKAAGRE